MEQLARAAAVLNQQKAQGEQAHTTLVEEREQLRERVRELRMQGAILDTEGRGLREALEELSKRQANALSDEKDRQAEQLRLAEELVGQEQEQLAVQALHGEVQQRREDSKRRREQETQEKLQIEAARSRTERENRDQGEVLLRLQRQVADLEQRVRTGDQEEAALLDRLWEQYELSHQGEIGRASCRERVLRLV